MQVAKCQICGQTNVTVAHVLGHGASVPETAKPRITEEKPRLARWSQTRLVPERWSGKPAACGTVSRMKPSQKQLEVLAVLSSDQPMDLKEIAQRLNIPIKRGQTLRARLYDLESMKLVVGFKIANNYRSSRVWKKV